MNKFDNISILLFISGILSALLNLVPTLLQIWNDGKISKSSINKILTAIGAIVFIVLLSTWFLYSAPTLPSGIDKGSTDTKSFWNNEGVTLYRLGNYTGAIWYYDKAIEMDSGYILAWSNRGIALKALHRDAEAEKAYAKARGEI